MMDLGILLPLVDDALPVVVCWSPKAGCTTATKWFLFQAGRLDEAIGHQPKGFSPADATIFGADTLAIHGYRFEKVYQATNARPSPRYVEQCEHALRNRTHCVTKVIRDPATRVVSNFSQFLLSASVAAAYRPWKMFLAWKRQTGFGFEETASFEQFVLFLLDCKTRGPFPDVHWAPQWHHLQDRYVDQLIPLETFATDIAHLENRLQLRRSNAAALSESSHHRTEPTPRPTRLPDPSCHPFSPSPTRDALPGASELLTERMRRLIRMAYTDDCAAYSSVYSC